MIDALIRSGAHDHHRDETAMVVWSSAERAAVERVTFQAFFRNSQAYKRGLVRAGVREGDRVAILSHPSKDYFYAVSALWLLGAVVSKEGCAPLLSFTSESSHICVCCGIPGNHRPP